MYQIKLTESATNSDIYFDVRRKQRFEPFEEYTEREKIRTALHEYEKNKNPKP